MGSSRGQRMLLSKACSCSAERRTRRPTIKIFKLPASQGFECAGVRQYQSRIHPCPWTPAGHFRNEAEASAMVRRIRDSKAAVRGGTSRCAKRPSWCQSDEACRSVVGGTRPPARGCFASRRIAIYGPPDTRTQLSTTARSETDLSACPLRGPDAKPTVNVKGRTVPLRLTHDRSGENNAGVTDRKPNSVVPATIDIIEIVSLPKVRRIVTGRSS
ncbi:hypothetical protein ACVWZZ_005721 [Bradyrhizobium sp. LM6.10]